MLYNVAFRDFQCFIDFQVETSAFTSWQHLVTFHHTFPNWRFDILTKLLQVFLHISLNNGLPQVCLDGTCLSSV